MPRPRNTPGVLAVLLAAAMLAASIVNMLAAHGYARLYVGSLVVGREGYAYVFLEPCSGEKTPADIAVRVWFRAERPVKMLLLDYEQFLEEEGRIDLYGYLAALDGLVREAMVEAIYPRSMPCWPLVLEFYGAPGTRVSYRVVLSQAQR